MKRTLLYVAAFALACFSYSCSDDGDLAQTELNLIAPNGDRIANNVNELSKWTSAVVLDKFGAGNEEFTITDVQYFDVAQGYVAQVNFEVNGQPSHFLIGNSSIDSADGRMEDPCKKWQVSCSGTSCCTPTFDVNTSQASCTCSSGSNSGCTLTATCLDQ